MSEIKYDDYGNIICGNQTHLYIPSGFKL